MCKTTLSRDRLEEIHKLFFFYLEIEIRVYDDDNDDDGWPKNWFAIYNLCVCVFFLCAVCRCVVVSVMA